MGKRVVVLTEEELDELLFHLTVLEGEYKFKESNAPDESYRVCFQKYAYKVGELHDKLLKA